MLGMDARRLMVVFALLLGLLAVAGGSAQAEEPADDAKVPAWAKELDALRKQEYRKCTHVPGATSNAGLGIELDDEHSLPRLRDNGQPTALDSWFSLGYSCYAFNRNVDIYMGLFTGFSQFLGLREIQRDEKSKLREQCWTVVGTGQDLCHDAPYALPQLGPTVHLAWNMYEDIYLKTEFMWAPGVVNPGYQRLSLFVEGDHPYHGVHVSVGGTGFNYGLVRSPLTGELHSLRWGLGPEIRVAYRKGGPGLRVAWIMAAPWHNLQTGYQYNGSRVDIAFVLMGTRHDMRDSGVYP